MKQKDLTTISTSVLKKRVNTQKVLTGILIVIVAAMFVLVFLNLQENVTTANTILPFAFLPLVIINLLNIRKMSKELKSRKN